MNEHNACLLCQSTTLNALKGYEHAFLVRCSACGFVFCGRVPSPAELGEHYAGYPRGEALSPITQKRYVELLNSFEPYRKHNRILDIGCGDGHFLETAKGMNWQVFGTEYTDEALAVCTQKGIEMQQGKLDIAHYAPDFFDVVTSFEVIEHINNPREDTQVVRHLLRTNGLFYVTTPNFNALSRLLLRGKWNVIEYPEHLCYYTPKTLQFLLKQYDFKEINTQTTGIGIGRIRQAWATNKQTNTNIIAEDTPTFRQTDEVLREKTENNPLFAFAKQTINAVLNGLKIGDAMKARYIKK